MEYPFHLKKIGQINEGTLRFLQKEIVNLPYERNNNFGSPDQMHVYDFSENHIMVKILLKELSSLINPATFKHASVDLLLKNSYIKEHLDQNIYNAPLTPEVFVLHKIHIPIITNPYCKQVWVTYEGKKNLKPKIEDLHEGGIYAYNNTIPHSCMNFGEIDRYHIIMKYYHKDDYEWMKDDN